MDGLRKSILLWRDYRSIPGSQYDTMTVQFNISSTPGYGTYLDDATDMPYGKTSEAVTKWQKFFGYKPCLFKNGAVVGYLNPNNYAQFEDGTSADITSGNAGDVMVEFPRRGIKISKSGSTVTVSMTKDPDNPDFTYYAHTRGSTRKDKFYIGAYLASYTTDTKYKSYLRSLSNKSVLTDYLSGFRAKASNNGNGYMNVGFYQFLYIQCMYLLQYKGNLDSQTVHGYGFNASSFTGSMKTGLADTNGLMYGEGVSKKTSGSYTGDRCSAHIKLFGIEDFWGNYPWYVDGFYINKNYHILTATDEFNNTGDGYIDNGTICGTTRISGNFISNAACNPSVGFIPTDYNGSSSTYFCDRAFLYNDLYDYTALHVGGDKTESDDSYYELPGSKGIFHFLCKNSPTSKKYDTVAGRLAYL